MSDPSQQRLRIAAPSFDLHEATDGLRAPGAMVAYQDELTAEYIQNTADEWAPPSREEWAETCAHMEWLGTMIHEHQVEAEEARRHLTLSESWIAVRDQVRDAIAKGSDDATLAAAREVTNRSTAIANEIRHVADGEGVPDRAATRLRWIASKLSTETR